MQVARIKCDKTPYMLPAGKHTGGNLRAFFGVSDDKDLWSESDDNGDVRFVGDTEAIIISDGDRFYTAGKKINGGG